MPVSHCAHAVSPGSRENVPCGQAWQAGIPAREYVPELQLKHETARNVDVFPASHVSQALWLVRLVKVPFWQGWHSEFPFPAEYVPGPQASQAPIPSVQEKEPA